MNKTNWKGYEDISGTYWCSVIQSASSRNLKLEIDKEFVWELFISQNKRCALSGVPIWFSKNPYKAKGTASVDRIDSDESYTPDNVQLVHKTINSMKQNLSDEDFVKWCHLVADYCGEL